MLSQEVTNAFPGTRNAVEHQLIHLSVAKSCVNSPHMHAMTRSTWSIQIPVRTTLCTYHPSYPRRSFEVAREPRQESAHDSVPEQGFAMQLTQSEGEKLHRVLFQQPNGILKKILTRYSDASKTRIGGARTTVCPIGGSFAKSTSTPNVVGERALRTDKIWRMHFRVAVRKGCVGHEWVEVDLHEENVAREEHARKYRCLGGCRKLSNWFLRRYQT